MTSSIYKQSWRARQSPEYWLKEREYYRNRHRLLMQNPEYAKKRAEWAKLWRRKHPEKRLFRGAKDRAREFNIPLDIELEDIQIPEVCPILKVPMQIGTEYAPSLDRIVPEKGYVKNNIQIISRKANAMKQNASSDELKEFANWVQKAFIN